MIYISSSCIKSGYLRDTVELLAKSGFSRIELSYGGKYYEGYKEDLLDLKKKYGLDYSCHNYFIPEADEFVLNLASQNPRIYKRSIEYLKQAIITAKEFGAKSYGFHAGFFLDIKSNEIGGKISAQSLYDKEKSMELFCAAYQELNKLAREENVDLYIENNVLTNENALTFSGSKPLMLLTFEDYQEISKRIDFRLLLDIGHLKVTSNSLGIDYAGQLNKMIAKTDYLHLSENDGKSDLHRGILKGGDLLEIIKRNHVKNSIMTLEAQEDISKIKDLYVLLEEATGND